MQGNPFSHSARPAGGPAAVLQRYRVGLGVVALFTLFVVLAVLIMAGGARQDAHTDKAANDASTKLEQYINDKQAVPDNLAQAGVKDVPHSITYKKLSDSSYRFCATYKSASKSIASSGVLDVVSRGLSPIDTGSYGDTGSDTSYLYINPDHKKGANCQKVTPYINAPVTVNSSSSLSTITEPKQASIASGNQQTVCQISGYATHYSGTIKSVATADGRPIVPTVTQDIVLQVTPSGDSPAGDQTIQLTNIGFNVFDSSCTALTHGSLAIGDYVSVFLDNSDQYMPGAIVDFSRR